MSLPHHDHECPIRKTYRKGIFFVIFSDVLGSGAWIFVSMVLGFVSCVHEFVFWVLGFVFWVSGLVFWVSRLVFWVFAISIFLYVSP